VEWAGIFGLNRSVIFGWNRSEIGWNWSQMGRLFWLELKSNGLVYLDRDGVKRAGKFGKESKGLELEANG
jgi:hypothetical protein